MLSLGCSIAAAYILNAFFPIGAVPSFTEKSPEVIAWLANAAHAGKTAADAITALGSDALAAATPAIRNWTLFSKTLGPVTVSLNLTFFIGAILMLLVFAIQHRGILGTANVQKYIGLAVIIPLLIVATVPFFNGGVHWTNFAPFVPPAAAYSADPGSWNLSGWTLVLGGMFIAAWSTYGFETAVCYTSEFRDPKTDTFKAIFSSGLLCLVLFILVPFTFQGVLGLNGMLAGPIVDGSGVAEAMGRMLGGGSVVTNIFVALMLAALMLSIMTAMAGSSRTLYQGSVDGWLPRYLSKVNEHGAPTRAMWTDLIANLFVLSIAAADATSFFFILAVSNCGYIVFNFLNLHAGWIHRIDSGHVDRPYRAPTFVLVLGAIFAFMNAIFMGAGAEVWNPNALLAGIVACLLIIPVFIYRHYVQDGGKFPEHMLTDIGVKSMEDLQVRKAGILPYLTLIAGAAVVLLSDYIFGTTFLGFTIR